MSKEKKIKGLCVTLVSSTASFRNPSAQLYHETLPLPSPSGVVGIAGAAMGLSFEDTLMYFKKNRISVGCKGKHKGKARDLWNYNKIKIEKRKITMVDDIIMREFLYNMEVTLYYASHNIKIIEKLKESFDNPVFSLTLGNSDDIAKIVDIRIIDDIYQKQSMDDLHETWIYENCCESYSFDLDKLKKIPIKQSIQPPIIEKLPVDYKFNKNGSREAISYIDVTYLNPYTNITDEKEVYVFNNEIVSLYAYGK